jgi:hypothetical protein
VTSAIATNDAQPMSGAIKFLAGTIKRPDYATPNMRRTADRLEHTLQSILPTSSINALFDASERYRIATVGPKDGSRTAYDLQLAAGWRRDGSS